MPPQLMSPRVPGVAILVPDATGPQYSRWRRGVKNAFSAKGTWGHCDGTVPMPMPESGPNFFSPVTSLNPQPQLLEDRRAWVKKDRDVKLDIFLSVADDIKLEVFEVGPPLPPSAMTAQEMIEALDERFEAFKFEEYHHVFCHFLNLHIDQYANLADFNVEFLATLDDLLDHGFPLSNIQACSAYFSKLRCTQNPWVARKLREWDKMATPPLLADLMKECPPWMMIRPLTMTNVKSTPQHLAPESIPESIPEEDLEASQSSSEGEAASDQSEVVTLSSKSSHSTHSRNSSNSTSHSQEITVHASYEDLTEAFPMPATLLPQATIPKLFSSKSDISKMRNQPPPPPLNRSLPPLPSDTSSMRSHSASPAPSQRPADPLLKVPTPPPSSRPQTPINQTHPALRTSTPTPSQAHISSAMRSATPSPPPRRTTLTSSLNLLSPSTPDMGQRPQSSRSMLTPQTSVETFSTWPSTHPLLVRIDSNNSSVLSLPLQGATVPEYRDMTIIEHTTPPSTLHLSSSPPRSTTSRLSSESVEDEKKSRKRSWSIKARLSGRRYDVKEMV